MDILAHALWVGVGVLLARRRWIVPTRTVIAAVSLAVLPDVFHLLPIAGWWIFSNGSVLALWAYAVAVPGHEPSLPTMVEFWSHHLHCVAHSAIIAGVFTLLVWALRRSLWIPLLGWWSHIIIDVFTHSEDYYPSPVLYPITERGFDGLAWNKPWFIWVNYGVLFAVGIGLWRVGKDRR